MSIVNTTPMHKKIIVKVVPDFMFQNIQTFKGMVDTITIHYNHYNGRQRDTITIKNSTSKYIKEQKDCTNNKDLCCQGHGFPVATCCER